jgi:leucyl/phenylalanyl-tRNA--protein transferase
VIRPPAVRISRSLRKRLSRRDYSVTLDADFDAVVAACAAPREYADGTWITDEMAWAYGRLHRHGLAHSVEVWMDEELVGGLYGVAIGRCFFGESMFMRRTDASKIAFVHLLGQLDEWEFPLVDCQLPNPHLQRLGVGSVSRAEFLQEVHSLVDQPGHPGPWNLEWHWPAGTRSA